MCTRDDVDFSCHEDAHKASSTGKLCGALSCEPFIEHDDGCSKSLLAQIRKLREQGVSRGDSKLEQKLNLMQRTLSARFCMQRSRFQTKVPKTTLRTFAINWRRGAGLRPRDLSWEDTARVICAGVGMLCRNHDGNKAGFVLGKVMRHLEEELSTLSVPTQPAVPCLLSNQNGRSSMRKMDAKQALRWERGCVWVSGVL